MKEFPMTKITLLKNLNRLDDFFGLERHDLNHLPEQFTQEIFSKEVYNRLSFLGWDNNYSFTVFLPYEEYLYLLSWALIERSDQWRNPDFAYSAIPTWGSAHGRLDRRVSNIFSTPVVTDIYFTISEKQFRITYKYKYE